jgi:glycerol-1-phosphate dehydrogenase [NAD(P)+]
MDFRFRDMLGRRWRCEFCGREHLIPTRWVDLEAGALERLPAALSDEGWAGRLLLVADETTYQVAGGRTARILKDGGFELDELIFPSSPKATRELGLQVQEAVEGRISGVVAVGSGTVNDLAKWGSYQAGKPYVVVPTAASMNGYTSSIAALSVHGVKRTLPAHPPVGIATEPEIVASAPVRMSSSGYADLQSKAVADIDWRLSHLLLGGYYCPLPRKGVTSAEKRLEGRLEGIARSLPESVSALLDALIESGISMTVAGSSTPASGGEHLISHWLDMQAHRSGRTPAMHGEQVGIGTLVAAKIYEIWLETDPEKWRPHPSESRPPDERGVEFEERYGDMAGEVMEEFKGKWLSPEERDRVLNEMRRRWDELREVILEGWVSPQRLRENLRLAGAPTSPAQIGVSEDEFRQAVLHAREIRGRWTSLDFAYLIGILPERMDELISVF